MLSKKMEKAFNDQINAELYSSYLYLSMSACFSAMNFEGFAQWMKSQALEESVHAMKIYHYVIERGGDVTLQPIDGPDTKWDTPLAAFEAAYAHEQYVTGRINDLMNLAIKEKDHAATIFLQWFVSEQVEEEATADGIVKKLKLVGDKGNGLFMIDRELGARTANFAALAGGGE
ncbi:MAG: ferritin [Deltaproteobacteria bacterium]|nr:ferritin [Candidatus Anaeroferrophillacea bacterium]